jgi:hypothetical protein
VGVGLAVGCWWVEGGEEGVSGLEWEGGREGGREEETKT